MSQLTRPLYPRPTPAAAIAGPIHRFFVSLVDSRDSGVALLTHLYLLLGCALPLWLHAGIAGGMVEAASSSTSTSTRPSSSLPPSACEQTLVLLPWAGLACLAVGDSAAAAVGKALGRVRWPGTGGRTVEGSVAFFASTAATLVFAAGRPGASLLPLAAAVAGATAIEAFTSQVDNLVLPVYFAAAVMTVAAAQGAT